MVSHAGSSEKKKQIAIYSDDSSVRSAVILALGNRIAADLPEHEIHEFATGPALRQYIDRKSQDGTFKIDLFIVDGDRTNPHKNPERMGYSFHHDDRLRIPI